jgi:DNA polymerase elongation subunit (family B)
MTSIKVPYEFKLIDFVSSNYGDDDFRIQMIGINDIRKTFSVTIDDFEPFVYIRVGSNWTTGHMNKFIEHLKTHPDDGGIRYQFNTNLVRYEMVKRKTLYDFDANKYYKFICIYAKNIGFINKLKSLYYDSKKQRLNESGGYVFDGTVTKIYECMIPPLLRFFHIQKISPSGWVRIEKYTKISKQYKSTRCDYEFRCKYKDIISLEEKETRVPYKICSFDIEASSSHGDFPNSIKNYKKVAYDIVNYFDKTEIENAKFVLKELMLNIFGFKENMSIDRCFVKDCSYHKNDFMRDFESFASKEIKSNEKTENKLQSYFENLYENQEDGGDIIPDSNSNVSKNKKKQSDSFEMNICDILISNSIDSPTKIIYLMDHMDAYFPSLEGDQVTFIGSTFINFGEKKPYLNHCICLNETENLIPDNQEIEYYDNEKDVLINWTELIKREDPDIIIGYNIFGFDYKFMFERASELDCITEFMDIGRTKNIKEELGETSIILASGAYDLKYMQMEGRLQVDLYTYMRKEFNLPSYKLDYVSSYLISDNVNKFVNMDDGRCMIYTKNMKGVEEESYVHFEIINHSNDIYNDGEKFKVLEFHDDGFIVDKHLVGVENEKLQWGLAKDDVTPQDIFRLTREGPSEKGIIAKYCIQDCNLVHHIFNKIDVMTSFVEMSKICSVPISYLVLRGQGIKLTSYIGKKCREKDTLMPLISKGHPNDAYEGAIVLEPKCNLYLDNPVACVDYSSLYPSSIISENISHDSKVWTKTYDLQGNLLDKSGITDKSGKFKYDNLEGYKYVDIKYDTFKYERKSAKAAARKVLTGYKVCRYAQFPDGEKAIMPSILHELLAARKATKKQMAKESDPFMKNILDKRQLSIKVTANSLYGQTGAKTSTFYEMDVAASTTATGRKLLIYAREIIENVYKNMKVDTKFGPMLTNAEYIYGDSVANYTPIIIRKQSNGLFEYVSELITIEDLGRKYGFNEWKACIQPGKEDKEYIDMQNKNIDTWTEKGWTELKTIIRHKLASHKKMFRIITYTGCVDVTDDHSLIQSNGEMISPKACKLGTKLLHRTCSDDFELDTSVYRQDYDLSIPDNHLRMAKHIQSLNTNYNIEHDTLYDVYRIKENSNTRSSIQDGIQEIKEIANYDNYVYDLTTENHHFAAGAGNMIVHNTDSVFFTFNLKDENGEPVRGKNALEVTIELAKEAGELATKFLKKPHDLEYEKTFMPFCLLSKKRYVGMLYEEDPNKCKRKSMGIVLKRRDNAPIVKDVYGGVIDILMKKQNIEESIEFVQMKLQEIIDKKIPIEKLIISKSLRSFYKNPQQVAHNVLADRMGVRDPGNKPSPGDRIPYVYIYQTNKKALQGDKIEHPEFIKKNKLKIDYGFYITNQIMKPVQQIYSLVLYDIAAFRRKRRNFEMKLETIANNSESDEQYHKKCQQLKDKEVEQLIFEKYLVINKNNQNNNRMITSFFK